MSPDGPGRAGLWFLLVVTVLAGMTAGAVGQPGAKPLPRFLATE